MGISQAPEIVFPQIWVKKQAWAEGTGMVAIKLRHNLKYIILIIVGGPGPVWSPSLPSLAITDHMPGMEKTKLVTPPSVAVIPLLWRVRVRDRA